MGLFDKFKKNSKNVKKENEKKNGQEKLKAQKMKSVN